MAILRRLIAVAFAAVILGLMATASQAEPSNLGPKACEECHKSEVAIWEMSKHFSSFREVHKVEKSVAILEAVGEDNMRRSDVCVACHYTVSIRPPSRAARATAGPSCEGCHGPASDWVNIHNNFGGANAKVEDETPAHRKERLDASQAAGMIIASANYAIAARCMTCHGLANPDVDAGVLATMLKAGHPVKESFELVQYSQGTVRHRFYRPNLTQNAQMTEPERARLFVEGHAAKFVSASVALARSTDEKYVAVQTARREHAKAALSRIGSVPEAAALLAAPTEDNARRLVAAIVDRDLTPEVDTLLPNPSTYK